MATGPRPLGRQQHCLRVLQLALARQKLDAASPTSFDSPAPSRALLPPTAQVLPIRRHDLRPVPPPPPPPPLDQPKVFRPGFSTTPGYGMAYAVGVSEAYAFLAPGHTPVFDEPFESFREQQLVSVNNVLTLCVPSWLIRSLHLW